MMDGQLFKEKHHRVLDGRDPNQDGCDVTRRTGASFFSCRGVKRGGRGGSLSGVDSIIALPSEGRIGRGGEEQRDGGAERAARWPDVCVSLGLFLRYLWLVPSCLAHIIVLEVHIYIFACLYVIL